MKRITLVCGHYGSGKTNFALNLAVNAAKRGEKITLVDLDIVNPYFRTKDAEDILTDHGIRVIAPAFANTNIENPALPPEIYSVFADKDCYVVFDVGGGEDGAIPLGSYYQYFAQEDCDVFFVLNQRRLLTADLTGALEAYREIAAVSRTPITALINNTHLKSDTTPEIIMEGQALAESASEKLGLPVAYISGTPENLAELPAQYESIKFPVQLYINLMF